MKKKIEMKTQIKERKYKAVRKEERQRQYKTITKMNKKEKEEREGIDKMRN